MDQAKMNYLKCRKGILHKYLTDGVFICAMLVGGGVAAPLNVQTEASSALSQTPSFLAADQDATTAWIPTGESKTSWIIFKLADPQVIKSAELVWQSGLNKSRYTVELSSDGNQWIKVWSEKGNDALTGLPVKINEPMEAGYVRVQLNGTGGISELLLNGQALQDMNAPKLDVPHDASYRNTALSPEVRAADVVSRMTDYEKLMMVGGYNNRYVRELKRFGLREVRMADASAGIHILDKFLTAPEPGSISYPCSVALAATWSPEVSKAYGKALASECRQLGVDILLGPGFNLYRTSTCGRNFEYLGEDPVLAGTLATAYIQGMQGEKVLAVAKHFICNNAEWRRHDADSIVDDRTLHELYMLPWYDVVHNGEVGSIMSSYNWLNGEKVSCGAIALNGLLRKEIGFNGFLMSDWGAAIFSDKILASGQDMSMPVTRDIELLSKSITKETMPQLDAMVTRILASLFKVGIYDRDQASPELVKNRPEWEKVALNAARESITLLKNNGILPLESGPVLVLGPSAEKTCYSGGGSGWVEGYDHKNIAPELFRLLGTDQVNLVGNWKGISDEQIRTAKTVVVCVDRQTKEGVDFYPRLEDNQEQLVSRCVALNPRTVVVVNSGSGLEMDWNDKAAAIVWGYYPGQYGGTAIAEVLTGQQNPSGKLPYTIERKFEDSPAFGYIPEGASWTKEKNDVDKKLPANPKVEYKEGVFIGYRWYDDKGLAVRYPFGHGLSYTTFNYEDMKVKAGKEEIVITASVCNTGKVAGAEVIQLYIGDKESSVKRPVRELKGYEKILLQPGEIRTVEFRLSPVSLAYYDVNGKNWRVEPGVFSAEIGSSSRDIRLNTEFKWIQELRYQRPTDKEPLK